MDLSPFSQQTYSCRCEWGLVGIDALAPADVTIVVDILSFTTTVDVAVSNGVAVLPYRWKDPSAEIFARAQGAELAGPRGSARFSLSPSSFRRAEPGTRCVLPSPNGAAMTLHAAASNSVILAGSLRNAVATATAARELGTTFNVIPAGERWSDGSLRPALEDAIGAGAILSHLPGTRSSEAQITISVFEFARQTGIVQVLSDCSSGRELLIRGFEEDLEISAELNVSTTVSRFQAGVFVSHT